MLCNGLSPIAKPLIVVQSSSAIRTYPSLGLATSLWTHSTVGTGTFTVEDDRIKLGQVMERRIDDTIKRRADEGTEEGQRWSRFLHAIKRRLLAGTGIDVPLIPKDLWLPELSFSSPTKVDSFGWAPLTYAVIEGRVDVAAVRPSPRRNSNSDPNPSLSPSPSSNPNPSLDSSPLALALTLTLTLTLTLSPSPNMAQALLDAGACIESPLQKNYYPLYALKGLTNLLYAAWFDGNGPMIRLLLSRGADPMRQCGPVKHSALHWACVFGSAGNAEALIEAEPRLLDLRLNLGTMPLTFIALGTQYAHLEWALKHHPGHCTDVMTGLPWGWLELACTDQAGNSDIIGLLIKQEGIDVNYYEPAKMNKVFAFITAVSKLALRLQDNPLQTFQLFAVGAATALHVAAFNGSLGSVELLLQAKANVASAAHPLKMTPLHVAAFAGHREMCVRLLEAGAPIAARDSRRRTAAMWAERRGHESVVLAISLHASAARAAAE